MTHSKEALEKFKACPDCAGLLQSMDSMDSFEELVHGFLSYTLKHRDLIWLCRVVSSRTPETFRSGSRSGGVHGSVSSFECRLGGPEPKNSKTPEAAALSCAGLEVLDQRNS